MTYYPEVTDEEITVLRHALAEYQADDDYETDIVDELLDKVRGLGI